MVNLFYQGGPLFMGILSVLFLIILVVAVLNGIPLFQHTYSNSKEDTFRKLGYLKSLGLLVLVAGILGQLLGLYMALNAVEGADDISPAILAGGLKVSLIVPIYGFAIFIIAYLIWFGLSLKLKK
jgi:biopolymer transport protein ExbB/TolQ